MGWGCGGVGWSCDEQSTGWLFTGCEGAVREVGWSCGGVGWTCEEESTGWLFPGCEGAGGVVG